MFDNRRYQGVIARAGRGRHALTCRRILEFNLLIIGALVFVGIGITSLQPDTGAKVTLKPMAQTGAQRTSDASHEPRTTGNGADAADAALLRGDGIAVRAAVLEVALPNQILTRTTILVAAHRMLNAAAPQRDGRAPDTDDRWVRAPHPLAVALPLDGDRPTHRIVQTSFGLIATDVAADPPAPLVRLDTTTGASPFWYVIAGLMLITFASGFWNSRKAHSKQAIALLPV